MENLAQQVEEALKNRDYAKLNSILDQSELEDPSAFESPSWPHAIHLMSHTCQMKLEDARFLYKRLPASVRNSDQNIPATFAVLQRLWIRDYQGIWGASSYQWPSELQGMVSYLQDSLRNRILDLISRAYANISASKLGALTGLSEGDAAAAAQSRGWTQDGDGLLVPKDAGAHGPAIAQDGDLKRLASYVVWLQEGESAPSSAADT